MFTILTLSLCLVAADEPQWQPLFDGKTTDGWKVVEFGGDGKIEVKDGSIILGMGESLTGITWAKEEGPPKSNYEIELEAMRVDGIDFFCGLTFPVKDAHCSFICGGWGGAVVGLSSINGGDASENETTKYVTFKKGQWYKLRVRVTDDNISCWIDGDKLVDQATKDRTFTTRAEVNLSKPLGISAWQTTAALRNIRLRKLAE